MKGVLMLGVAAWALGWDGLQPASASVTIDGTRVIYPASKREVTINLHSNGDAPSLVQAWLDAGDEKSKPGEAKVPFVLSPPLFRLDPNKGQSLRLIYTQEPLPADRESIFWLNVLDIPPRVTLNPDQPNQLQLAYKQRIKLFFRPPDLPGTAAEAPGRMTWKLVPKGSGTALEASNPTPYHVNLIEVTVLTGSATLSARADMVPPMASRTFELPKRISQTSGTLEVKYHFVNDYGGVSQGTFSGAVGR